MNTYKFLRLFRERGADPKTIQEAIEEFKADLARRKKFYERYKASVQGVPILTRQPVDYEDFETGKVMRIDSKVNNHLNNAFDAEIVDTKVGYMFGHPISYDVDNKHENENGQLKTELENFIIRNNVEDKDSEWGKKAAICGYAARLCYIDKDGKERILNVDPWETIIISGTDFTEPEFSIRFFDLEANKLQVEFYDGSHFYVLETGATGLRLIDKKPHTFDYCPLFGLPNNEELMADAEKVFKLIDAYDRTLSDANNEIEQYRLAYLVLRGLGLDDEDINTLKKTGVFELMGKDDSVSYLTKDINDTMIENHLNRLEQNILRFAKSVNFSDEAFGNNVSGVAMKYKLMALENKCITMERKMTAALRYQYKVLCSAWDKKGICSKEDFLKIFTSFKRNIPVNLLEEAQTAVTLKAVTSEKTALASLSIVDDVDYEIEQREREMDKIPPLKDGDDSGS
ncbi:phage portal protein [Cytobacillus pseudoceanisediminis]